jgi:hypothetical protein
MKIRGSELTSYRNTEHLQFHTDTSNLIEATDSELLLIKAEFETYQKSLALEGTVIKKATKSPLTEQIQVADKARDDLYRGITAAVTSSAHHFKADLR